VKIDGYSNENGGGFHPPLNETDTIKYTRMLSRYAHSLGLAMGLKNAQEILANVTQYVEFAVNEVGHMDRFDNLN
jgi:glycosyl hydrolase family 114